MHEPNKLLQFLIIFNFIFFFFFFQIFMLYIILIFDRDLIICQKNA